MNYMPGTASLIQDIDKKHLVLLRDGRTLIGYLRSIDQFGTAGAAGAAGGWAGEEEEEEECVRFSGVIVLGLNVRLCVVFPWTWCFAEDLEKESDTPLQQVSIEEILEEQRVEQQAKQESEKLKVQALKERGLSVPRADTLDEY
ncbi:hypothetical protein DUI87_28404 [Hirundo rustica rustica]|uniref:LSM domain-containing protein n=1 Tax=Hirundo rustica rustica TaxID=333673 RepID=A0A3M0J2M2_HIRRU|nr:hypothetical protein DUI87_28404 [Hirundo rustica rustica]